MLRFFEDLCTVPEIKAMSQRLEVAHMLSNNCVYSDIVAKQALPQQQSVE